jgi:hypothetical protein
MIESPDSRGQANVLDNTPAISMFLACCFQYNRAPSVINGHHFTHNLLSHATKHQIKLHMAYI